MTERRRRPVAERFWPKVDKSGDCWVWTAAMYGNGYGKFGGADRSPVLAHRMSYELTYGVSLTREQKVLHRCDNRPCVNPDHLFLGTTTDNIRDMIAKGRGWNQVKTHCKSGHPFSEENTAMRMGASGNRVRQCRTCERRWKTESKQRRREAAAA